MQKVRLRARGTVAPSALPLELKVRRVRDGVEVVQQEIRAVDPLAATQALLQVDSGSA